MRIEFFTIPIQDTAMAVELNQFLANHAVLSVERQFVQDGENSVWAICVSYQERQGDASNSRNAKVDYKEVLNEQQFAVYAKLRDLRKMLAEQQGLPAYALFNNKQLAELVQNRVVTLAAMKKLTGVGEARAEKYGADFIKIIAEMSEKPAAEQ